LLSTYHVGTNRVLSFMLPRPHIRQAGDDREDDISTFVDGPRELEGIQDLMYVVTRPRDMRNIRLEARVDTAHIANTPIEEYLPAGSHLFSFEVQGRTEEAADTTSDASLLKSAVAAAVGLAGFVVPAAWLVGLAAGLFSSRETTRYYTWNVVTFTPPPDTKFDVAAGWSWSNVTSSKNVVSVEVLEFTETKIVAFGTVFSETYSDSTLGADWLNPDPDPSIGRYASDLVVNLVDEKASVVSYEKSMFTVSHGLCCPPVGRRIKPGVVHEVLPPIIARYPSRKGARIPLLQARRDQLAVADYLVGGLRGGISYDEPVDVIDTAFYGRDAVSRLPVPLRSQSVVNALAPAHREAMERELPRSIKSLSYAEALRLPVAVLDKLAGVNGVGVKLRRALLGVDSASVEARAYPTVPAVTGLLVGQARRLLAERGLRPAVEWAEGDAPSGVVLAQELEAGANVPAGTGVTIVVATHAIRMPAVVGLSLDRARLALRRGGVAADASVEGDGDTVVEQLPPSGERMLPDSPVLLRAGDAGAAAGEA
jgi:hypothetical protein